MSLYKLVQFLKNYINLEKVKVLIEICSRIAWSWLNKHGYEYNNVRKIIFIDIHEQPIVIENCANFLKVIKDLKTYVIEFETNKTMKPKLYLNNCVVDGPNWQPVIVITHNKYTFFANNGIH